jgi:predicted O-linked N-acetylglucosamine transferase (SPINDLY family)
MTTAATFETAKESHRAGRLAEAEQLYRQVLSKDTTHADAAFLLGVIALGSGRIHEGVDAFRLATRLAPSNGVYEANLGEAYRRQRRFADGAQSLAKAMFLRPDLAEPVFNMGLILEEAREPAIALSCFERAAEINGDSQTIVRQIERTRAAIQTRRPGPVPSSDPVANMRAIRALLALADVNRALGRRDRVLVFCRRAFAYGPRFIPALMQLGEALANTGLSDESVVRFRQVLEIEPDHAEAAARLVEVLRSSDRLGEGIEHLQRCLQFQNHSLLRSLLLLTLPYIPDYDDAAILMEARIWDREHGAPLSSLSKPFDNEPAPDRRLRIGYVSPSFREHVHLYFLQQLLAKHDRTAFELFLYSDVTHVDVETERYRQLADTWREIFSLSHDAVAEVIRADRIDILIDLTMHTDKNRMLVFARKPAPVQVCWLAYPGTTGLSSMDYRITDRYLDPPGGDRSVYAERSLVLQDSFWCYEPRTSAPEPAPLPALTRRRVAFGCLNNYVKVNPPVLEMWARVLRAVDGSTLTLLAPSGDVPRRTLGVFEKNGVDPARVIFVDRCRREGYLALYQNFDLCLDTFPYNGHTTSLDSFWMGVPVVVLSGKTVVGRAGVCFAMNLGLPELVAATPEEYVRIAVQLATDLPRLEALRAGLRERMAASPLMDGARFARNLENLYRQAWRDWCSG